MAALRQACAFRRSFCTRKNAVKVQPNLYTDPTRDLQQYLQVPLFNEHEKPFILSENDIVKAQSLFRPDRKHEIKFYKSVVGIENYPKGNIPEVIFIGQSNIGKSSLIQAIFRNAPNLKVKTSKKPGHTKLLNFFQVGEKLFVVDAPGYGVNQPESFVKDVETYLKTSKNLQRIFLLTDASVGLSDWDEIAMKMLEEFHRPYALVMTKIDLASHSQRLMNLLQLQEIRDKHLSPCCFPQPFLVSNITYEGVGYLKAFVAYVTFNLAVEGL